MLWELNLSQESLDQIALVSLNLVNARSVSCLGTSTSKEKSVRDKIEYIDVVQETFLNNSNLDFKND